MNKAILMGRLTRDPELKTTSSNIYVATFSVAIDRNFKDASGNRQADFINCVAWRSVGEFVGKYFKKGERISIVGSIQSRSYEGSDGQRRTVIEVVADEVGFVDFKAKSADEPAQDPFDI